MASPSDPRRPEPRLYLVTPEVAEVAPFADALAAALTGAEVAAVLLRSVARDERGLINAGKALAPLVQKTGAALIPTSWRAAAPTARI
jgi:thiamine-phosphate pyrophosphorylase